MTQTESEILSTLIELESAVASMPGANTKPDLLPLFSRLDLLTRQLPAAADPLLLHYLHKKSYQKARLFLQGRDAENAAGNCRGHVDAQGNPWPDAAAASLPQTPAEDTLPPAR